MLLIVWTWCVILITHLGQRSLLVFLALATTPGCTTITHWVKPEWITPAGVVSGAPAGAGNRRSLVLGKPGAKVKLWLRDSSLLCGAETQRSGYPVCKLEGKFLRLDFSAGKATGLVVTATSVFLETSGTPPTRKTLPLPTTEVRLPLVDITAIGVDESTSKYIRVG